MDRKHTLDAIRERVIAVVLIELGHANEELVGNGLIDSVKAISVALSLEHEFGISLEDLSLTDMATLSSLSEKIQAITSHATEPK
jgi:acyl carrier protein